MNFLSTAFAQINLNPGTAAGGAGGLTGITINEMISWAVTIIIVVAGLIFFFMLILGGLKWILSGGDKGQTEAARGQITAALVGLVILFSAYAIVNLIDLLFGVNILNLSIPTLA